MRAGFGVNSSALLATVLAVGMMVVPIHRTEAQSPAATGSAAQKLPADIDPVSRMRLPPVKRADLDDHGKAVWDKVTDTPNDPNTPVTGPSGIRLYSPFVAEHLNAVNQYLRKIPSLRLAELAICNAAREANSPYEWGAHEAAAQKAGVEQEVIDIVKYRKPLPAIGAVRGLGEKEHAIIALAREMLRAPNRVSSQTFANFKNQFGPKVTVELISLMAHYSATAFLLNAMDIQPNPSPNSPLPLP
jgi:alkylhydroperoxidase family enzyme